MAFLKQASLTIENPDININKWINRNPKIKVASQEKLVDYKSIIPDFNPDDYLLTHCTIIASVNVENAPTPVSFKNEKTQNNFKKLEGSADYYITPDTSKYINSNGDAWTKELLKKTYKTFIGAENYLEHLQDPKYSKGKILDAALREVDDGKSLFVDILVATNKKHKDLVNKISSGELTTLSMGAAVDFTICTKCGRVATDETELCEHIKYEKKNSFISEHDGKKRVVAELCGSPLYEDSNKFIEGSWVENPAFVGAVLRNEIKVSEEMVKQAILKNYSKIINSSPELKEASRILVAALKKSKVALTPVEDAPEEKPADEPVPEVEDKPADEPVIPDELKGIGEPPVEEEIPEEELAEETKKPYDKLKEDIKETLKHQIKEEILKELGTKIINAPELPHRNDNLVHSSKLEKIAEKIRVAASIMKKEGFTGLYKNGYSREEVLKLAFLSNRYSINKDLFKTVNKLGKSTTFATFRRYMKAVEADLNRDLTMNERRALELLLQDVES